MAIDTNHDPEMLAGCERPQFIIERIRGTLGHLSNKMSGEAIADAAEAGNLTQAVLLHLSGECNTEELALNTVRSVLIKRGVELPLIVSTQDAVLRPIDVAPAEPLPQSRLPVDEPSEITPEDFLTRYLRQVPAALRRTQ